MAGIEIEPKAARAAGLEVRGTIEEVAELAPFDCITFWHSLEHLPDPVHAVRIANRLLTPEGVLCIAVPDFGGLQAPLFGPDWLHLDVPRHLHHFTPSSLTRLLEQCGFKPRKTWHQEFEYDLLGWIQSAINKLLPTQNLFFDMLRGKTPKAPIWEKITAVTIGPLLGIPALPATWLGTLAGRGGTLIIAASKASSSS